MSSNRVHTQHHANYASQTIGEAHHYWIGTKLLAVETSTAGRPQLCYCLDHTCLFVLFRRICFFCPLTSTKSNHYLACAHAAKLVGRMIRGHSLSRRERRQLVRATTGMGGRFCVGCLVADKPNCFLRGVLFGIIAQLAVHSLLHTFVTDCVANLAFTMTVQPHLT